MSGLKTRKSIIIVSSVCTIVLAIGVVLWVFISMEKAYAKTQVSKSLSVRKPSIPSDESSQPTEDSNTSIPHAEEYALGRIEKGQSEQVIKHVGYTVSYNLEWLIPNWVGWLLTAEETRGEVERSNHFRPDPDVKGDPVVTKDYSNSGYDRGHMAPAADMKWSEQAMRESFYMTNMCPQQHSSNAGDWKEIEEMGRDLAVCYDSIYIVCGPIVKDNKVTIGTERKIVVPEAFYKAFLRKTKTGWTAVAFRLPNGPSNQPMMTYMRTVDEIEAEVGLDLFYNLPDSIEEKVEADFTISDWTVR